MDALISRQAAIDLLREWSGGYDYIETDTKSAIEDFNRLPSAQPEPKKAQWLLTKVYENEYGVERYNYLCSKCGAAAYDFRQPFCHNCGSLMGGGDDGV